MGRWTPNARGRLERAALDLFIAQGFSATTVPQITKRAGLTTRTFFRHFADKREVFFDGDAIPDLAERMLSEAPPEIEPLELLRQGLRQVASDRFDGHREEIRLRRDVILAEPALRERDAQKRDDLVHVIRHGLAAREVGPIDAALLAETTVTVLNVALEIWLAETGERSLGDVTDHCFERLSGLLVTSETIEPPGRLPT